MSEKTLRSDECFRLSGRSPSQRAAFFCPGCNTMHEVPVAKDGSRGASSAVWILSGTLVAPTLHPSILVTGVERLTDDEYRRVMKGELVAPRHLRCHSFLRDGRLQFLADCTHRLASTTVPLPPIPSLSCASLT